MEKTMTDHIPGNRVLTYAYPSGDTTGNHLDIVGRHYNGGRGVIGGSNFAERTCYMNTRSRSSWPIDIVGRMIDDPTYKYYRGWLDGLKHQIKDSRATDAENQLKYDEVEVELAHVKNRENEVWVDTYTNISRYGQERDTHHLQLLSVAPTSIKMRLTDKMFDTAFDYPLTVKVRINNDWNNITVTQNQNIAEFKNIEHNGKKYLLIRAVPDRGEIIINKN